MISLPRMLFLQILGHSLLLRPGAAYSRKYVAYFHSQERWGDHSGDSHMGESSLYDYILSMTIFTFYKFLHVDFFFSLKL